MSAERVTYKSLFPDWEQSTDIIDSKMVYMCGVYDEETSSLCENRTGLRFRLYEDIPPIPCCSAKCKERLLKDAEMVEFEIEVEETQPEPVLA